MVQLHLKLLFVVALRIINMSYWCFFSRLYLCLVEIRHREWQKCVSVCVYPGKDALQEVPQIFLSAHVRWTWLTQSLFCVLFWTVRTGAACNCWTCWWWSPWHTCPRFDRQSRCVYPCISAPPCGGLAVLSARRPKDEPGVLTMSKHWHQQVYLNTPQRGERPTSYTHLLCLYQQKRPFGGCQKTGVMRVNISDLEEQQHGHCSLLHTYSRTCSEDVWFN